MEDLIRQLDELTGPRYKQLLVMHRGPRDESELNELTLRINAVQRQMKDIKDDEKSKEPTPEGNRVHKILAAPKISKPAAIKAQPKIFKLPQPNSYVPGPPPANNRPVIPMMAMTPRGTPINQKKEKKIEVPKPEIGLARRKPEIVKSITTGLREQSYQPISVPVQVQSTPKPTLNGVKKPDMTNRRPRVLSKPALLTLPPLKKIKESEEPKIDLSMIDDQFIDDRFIDDFEDNFGDTIEF